MNKEELKELAATLNGIADGNAWETIAGPGASWESGKGCALDCVVNGWKIRIKQPPDPYAELKAAHAAGKKLQHRFPDESKWSDCSVTDTSQEPYCFVFEPECYRIKPEQHKLPLCSDDVKSGDEFLVGSYRQSWLSIKDGLVTYGSGGMYSFEEMMQFGHKIRSIGETEWRPCYKLINTP